MDWRLLLCLTCALASLSEFSWASEDYKSLIYKIKNEIGKLAPNAAVMEQPDVPHTIGHDKEPDYEDLPTMVPPQPPGNDILSETGQENGSENKFIILNFPNVDYENLVGDYGKKQTLEQYYKNCHENWRRYKDLRRSKLLASSSKATTTSNFPWYVEVQAGTNNCGGVLLSSQLVVTAAHCLSTLATRYERRKGYCLCPGQFSTIKVFYGQKSFDVTKLLIHPHYQQGSYKFDLAFLEIASPINAPPACFSDRDVYQTTHNCVAVGEGSSRGVQRGLLRQGRVTFKPMKDRDCAVKYGGGYKTTDETTCASLITCPGDSGSGVVCVRGDVHYLQGIFASQTGYSAYGCSGRGSTFFTNTSIIFDEGPYPVTGNVLKRVIENYGKCAQDIRGNCG